MAHGVCHFLATFCHLSGAHDGSRGDFLVTFVDLAHSRARNGSCAALCCPRRRARDGSRPQRTAPQRCDYVAPSPVTCNFMRTALRTTALRTGYFMRTSLRTESFIAALIAGFLRFFCPELGWVLTAAN